MKAAALLGGIVLALSSGARCETAAQDPSAFVMMEKADELLDMACAGFRKRPDGTWTTAIIVQIGSRRLLPGVVTIRNAASIESRCGTVPVLE